ncbi:NlpC/P60 family phage cell wall peptidase [Ketogulonicigenium robustum]|uniref:NlpC/P60 family phage cell wall peptidase n=1 Tax=Ketogulonicigenium robustum TaxID=92947 RepID=A0A1W6NYV7_9RHOB|nr:hypothetical protein [Ketogulonicigenium robustum]ARO14280.1 NlpC/P60 family phage cell wall peptidase [Ketogulonicigenium robustum]
MTNPIPAARRWLGTPFVPRASCRGAGADCLGLIRGLWRDLHGAEPWPIPAYGPDWPRALGDNALQIALQKHLPSLAAPRTGAVLLFRLRAGQTPAHLGLCTGTHFIHAHHTSGTIESPLSTPWRHRIAGAFALIPKPQQEA